MVKLMRVRVADERCVDRLIAIDTGARGNARRQAFLRDRTGLGECWIVEEGAEAQGYAVRGEFHGFDFLELLYVADGFRRRGAGSALLDAVEAARRTDRLFTSTNRSNAPMQALLSRRGYAPTGVIHNLDRGDPELVYVKRFDGVTPELPSDP